MWGWQLFRTPSTVESVREVIQQHKVSVRNTYYRANADTRSERSVTDSAAQLASCGGVVKLDLELTAEWWTRQARGGKCCQSGFENCSRWLQQKGGAGVGGGGGESPCHLWCFVFFHFHLLDCDCGVSSSEALQPVRFMSLTSGWPPPKLPEAGSWQAGERPKIKESRQLRVLLFCLHKGAAPPSFTALSLSWHLML